ncbi:MAG: hypothetical protein MI723_03190, partial [Caulobacterales bacterium]|nr:hypothetical protein [Caulobacterales bacterium]
LEPVLAHYAARLGGAAPPPSVLLAYRPSASRGFSFKGGALVDQLMMEVGGSDLEADALASYLRTAVAHEAAHLWNSQIARPSDSRHAWLHEGGAEALSWRAIEAVGAAEPGFARARFEEALNACAAHLANGPLNGAAARRDYRAYYDCGASIMLAVESDLYRGQPDRDIHDLWAALLARAREHHQGSYDQTIFLRLISDLGARPQTIAWIGLLTERTLDTPPAMLVVGLRKAGVDASLRPDRRIVLKSDRGPARPAPYKAGRSAGEQAGGGELPRDHAPADGADEP